VGVTDLLLKTASAANRVGSGGGGSGLQAVAVRPKIG
jgi:hypothetical protein